MPAQCEEAVVHPHARQTEYLAPRVGNRPLQRVRGRRRNIIAGLGAGLWLWKRVAIEFAVGRERQRVHTDERCRNHVLGQLAAHELGKAADARRHVLWHDVGHQAPVASRANAREDHRLTHLRVLAQGCFDLVRLDAETPKLDLVIEASEEFEMAVSALAYAVAGSIEPRARLVGEWIGDEALGRQVRPSRVAAGKRHAAHAQLAGHTDR